MSWFPSHRAGRSRKRDLLAAATPEPAPRAKALRDPVEPGVTCADCGGKMVRKNRRSDGRAFLSCSRFPLCRYATALKPRKPKAG